jgi:hypothetical protein
MKTFYFTGCSFIQLTSLAMLIMLMGSAPNTFYDMTIYDFVGFSYQSNLVIDDPSHTCRADSFGYKHSINFIL